MNILYYMEPHPIRNMFTNFNGTMAKLLPLLQNNFEGNDKVYIYSNKTALNKLAGKYAELKDYLIYPTDDEETFFQSKLKDWETEGINEWIDLMSKPDKNYAEIIKRVCKEYDLDIVIHWASNATVRHTAKQLKIGYADLELGCCRAPYMPTLAADPWGVNGSAVLSRAKIKDLKIITDVYPAVYDLQYSSGDESAIMCGYNYITDNSLLSIVNTRKKIAFIPLQLFDDANLLIYSPYKSPKEALQDVLPKLKQNDYFCIIKEHPLSERRGGLSLKANREAKDYAQNFKNVLWVDNKYKDINNALYYKMSDLIITVNSSTGFEGLLYDKPCIVLGEAVYKVGGVFPSLNQYFSPSFSFAKYQYHAAQIRSFFLRSYLLNEKLLTPEYFMKKIKMIGEMGKKNMAIEKIIETYYNYRS